MVKVKGVTKKQIEILQLIYPTPIGAGLTILEAAQLLGIHRNSAQSRLNNFKKRFPNEWNSIKYLISKMYEHRKQLIDGAEHGMSLSEKYDVWTDNFDEYIVEKF